MAETTPEEKALHDRLEPGVIAEPLTVIADTLTDPIIGKALDGTIHSWSAGAEELYGYRAEEVVGKPISILAPPERRAEIEEILERVRRGEAIRQFETVRRKKDGTDVDVSLSITPLRDSSAEIVGASAVAHDISERKRREEIQSFLAEASRLLAVNVDHHETLPEVASLTLLRIADGCSVEIFDGTGTLTQVAIAHREPDKAELMREMRRLYPPEAESRALVSRVLRTGTAELITEVSDQLLRNIAQDPRHLHMLREFGTKSVIVVPLRVRGRALGTVMLMNGPSGRRFSAEDLELAEDLAQRVALAIDNATLHESEQEARRKAEQAAQRIGRLQAVTAALSGAPTPAAVAEVLVGQGAAAVGADGGFVRILTADGLELELLAATGMSEPFVQSYGHLSLTSPLPGADVFRTGSERYFESAAAVRAASSEFAREHEVMGQEAIAFVPLHVQRRTIGVMALSFATPRTFDRDDRELLATLAGQCAQALERARLYEAERQARAEAEDAIGRTMRLQSLAAELAEALTPAQVAEVVVAHGMASIDADAGALQLLSDDGKMLEVVNGRGSDRTLIEAGWRRFSVDLELPSTDALHRLEPVFIESEKDIREKYPHVEDYPHVVESQLGLHARAGAHIPLVLSGRPLGVLFLGFTRPRRFSDSQRSFVLALGRQCAQALKRAQLYEAEFEERGKLSRLVERLHEGVVSVDRHGRVEFASSKAKELLSAVSLEEGRRVPEAWLGFPLRSFAAGLLEADEDVVEAQVVSDDDERVFNVTGIPAARSESVLLVVTDVSDRERQRRAEREFVDNAAHELRTPLAAITSAIERLQAGAREVPEKRDRFLGHIQQESTRLNRLASSLLVLARAQTREEDPRREEIALRALIEELVGGLELKPGVELVIECPPDLIARTNRDLLEHALLNLAGNAALHTDRGRIGIRAFVEGDGSVVIEISDTGSGIRPEELGRLFDRFYRGPSEEGRAGFGLGLPITKEAVEAVGGRVEIDSVAGEGTTARIVLPGAGVTVPA
ncbi:MAG TPA: GAF domain-containing protein [Gaiellaceae bacterium]|nr:GAF domain-containing protein [Gaiellaceae bacterium]